MAGCLPLEPELLPGCGGGVQEGRKSPRYRRHSWKMRHLGLMPVIKVAIITIAWLLGLFVAILKLLDLKACCFGLS